MSRPPRHGVEIRRLVCVSMLAVCWMTASPLNADDAETAKAKFNAGVAMFQRENYPAALKAFEDSYRLNPKLSVLYNIAMCQKALFRYVDSIKTFNRYLSKGEGQIPTTKKSKALAAVDEMKLLVGTLIVENAPAEAEVLVDGEKVGILPLASPVMVDPGDHTVHVVKLGFDSFETKISVDSGANLAVRAELEPLVAKLIVDCRAEDAVIKVDGKIVGGCPVVGDVSAGVHEVTVSSPTTKSYTRTVEVGPGGEMTVSVALVPKSEEESADAGSGQGEPPGDVKTPEVDDSYDSGQRKTTPLFIAGITALTVGAGMGVVGAVFTAKASKDVDRGDEVWDDMIRDQSRDEAAFNEHLAEYNEIRNDDLKRHSALMISGYVVGGVLMTAGVVLAVVGRNVETSDEPVSVSPDAGGFTVRF
jgi:hypothetical protein